MDRDFLIQLTNSLYKLTLLFPKKEPLRYKMREMADEILAKPKEKNFDILDGFFEVAKVQNWVSPQDVLAIQTEYANLRQELKKPKLQVSRKKKEGNSVAFQKMPDREEKILSFLRENGRAQIWQIKQVLPQVTKRTLRRDFDSLLKQRRVERIGERNDTFYKIRAVRS